MFKMLSICMHACSQSLSPLVDGCVNNVLLQTVPDVNEAQLQLIDTVHTTFIHSLLHNRLYNPLHSGLGWLGPMKSSISCCGCLMVSLHDEMERCLVEDISLATCLIAGSICWESEHCGNTGCWLSFQGWQRSTKSYPFSTQQWKPQPISAIWG